MVPSTRKIGMLALYLAAVWFQTTAASTAEHGRNFENDIVPILNKFGCNTSGCHGKAEGQNGFKLSVFGFDPMADYRAITMEGRGRRFFPASPEQSLILRKATGMLPHGGGSRISPDRPEYATLRDWLIAGAPFGSPDDPRVVSIELSPDQRQLGAGASLQLRVESIWSDGHRADVTRLATYQSNNEGLAVVDADGRVTVGQATGDVAIMATYLGNVDVFRAIIPRGEPSKEPPQSFAEANFIDRHVHAKLAQLNIMPSDLADDATFQRRVYLDLIGTLPTPAETEAFLQDARPDRRQNVVESLFKRTEYADYWALKWSDLLRVNRLELGRKRAYLYYKWIRDSFAANKPLDRFAHELISAEGPLEETPAGQFYKVVSKPNQMASTLSQVFLGIRIECAQCHHHPYDRWGQDDYFGMQAFFTQVAFKNTEAGETLVHSGDGKTVHPRTGKEVFAHALGEPVPARSPAGNRREYAADWFVSGKNAWFARNLANRMWAHLMGRGLVEPVDDIRLTNPPTHPELLDELAAYLVQHRFDQQALIRLITSSHAYQRSTHPNVTNERDEQNYARYPLKRLDAEVLFDSVCDTTGVPEKFTGVPAGSRAIQLWDSHVPHYFLQLFGRPVRATACECERVSEPIVSQVLHVLNSPEIQRKLSHESGRIAALVRRHSGDEPLIREMYLTFFCRPPTDEERNVALKHFAAESDRRRAAEDLAWSMMNSLEFLFNH